MKAFDALRSAARAQEPEDLLELAAELDRTRTPDVWNGLVAHHQFADPGLVTTAFEHHAAVLAAERGVFAFDRSERYFYRPLPDELHPNVSLEAYSARLVGGKLETPEHWPFRTECPVGDFERGTSLRWWSHGLVHAMVGWLYWPNLSELEFMAAERFSESFAVWHWYWLCELGRDRCPAHARLMGVRIGYCPACAQLEALTPHPEVRAQRLAGDYNRWLAESGADFLVMEIDALQAALERGEIALPPSHLSLSLGDACEYMQWHHARWRGPVFERWLDACMRPDVDYASSPESFAEHVRGLLTSMLSRPPREVCLGAAERARKVLQDIGFRLCAEAAHCGQLDAADAVLSQLSDTLDSLSSAEEAQVNGLLATALEATVEAQEQLAPGVTRIFALGYPPILEYTLEPTVIHQARVDAAARAMRSARIPATLTQLLPEVVSRPRWISSWTGELLMASQHRPEIQQLLVWLSTLYGLLRIDPHVLHNQGWTFRLSLKALPPLEQRSRYRLHSHDQLQRVGALYSAEWLHDFLYDEAPMPPRPLVLGQKPAQILVGPTPSGPVFELITGDLARLLELADHRATLEDAVEALGEACLERALRSQWVGCFEG